MTTRVNVDTNMIIWAIQRAGYELYDFAEKFPKVLDWIEEKNDEKKNQL